MMQNVHFRVDVRRSKMLLLKLPIKPKVSTHGSGLFSYVAEELSSLIPRRCLMQKIERTIYSDA